MPPHPNSPIPYIDKGHLFALARISMASRADVVTVALDMGFNVEFKSHVRLYHVDCPDAQSNDPLEKKAGMVASLLVEFWIKTSEALVLACAAPQLIGGFILGDLVRMKGGDSLSQLLFHTNCAKQHDKNQKWSPLELERCIAEGCKMMRLDPESLPQPNSDSTPDAANGGQPAIDMRKPAGQD